MMALISPFLRFASVLHWRRILLSVRIQAKDKNGCFPSVNPEKRYSLYVFTIRYTCLIHIIYVNLHKNVILNNN